MHRDATPSRCPAFEFLSPHSTAHRLYKWLQLVSRQWYEPPHFLDAFDVSDMTPHRIADSPSMAAALSQSTRNDARYLHSSCTLKAKNLLAVGLITSAQILGSLLVRRNIDSATSAL